MSLGIGVGVNMCTLGNVVLQSRVVSEAYKLNFFSFSEITEI